MQSSSLAVGLLIVTQSSSDCLHKRCWNCKVNIIVAIPSCPPFLWRHNLEPVAKQIQIWGNDFSKAKSMSLFTHDSIMLSAHVLSSVCPSVRLSVARMDQSKTVEVRIAIFTVIAIFPIPLVSSRNSDGFPLSRASNKGGVWKTSYFLALCVNISKTVRDASKVRPTIND